MTERGDLVSVVEHAYRFDLEHDHWLAGVLAAARPFVDRGFGAWSFVLDGHKMMRGELAYRHPTALGLPSDWLVGLHHTLSITVQRPEVMRETMFSRPFHSMSEILRRNPRLLTRATGAIEIPGVRDSLGISCLDPSGHGVFIGAHADRIVDLDAATRDRFGRIAAHIATAFRLRRALGPNGRCTARELVTRADAVVHRSGKVEHAVGAAAMRENLVALKAAARGVDRATRALRNRAPDEALHAWQALVRGRWSLVASFDDADRRYLLAAPNAPSSEHAAVALTRRERQIASYLVLGHAHKLIAYELGLATGTVSSVIARLRNKLGARTRAELLSRLGALWRRGRLSTVEGSEQGGPESS